MILTVATYNIVKCEVRAGVTDVPKVGAMIKSLVTNHGVTLVALQEVKNWQIDDLARAAGFPYWYYGARQSGSDWGNGILSKYPLTDKRTALAPHSGGSTCLASALVTVPEASVPFRFGSVHPPVTSTLLRMSAIGNMIQEGRKYGNYIIGGDFNSSNGGIEFGCLKAFGWTPSCQENCPNTTNHAPPANNWPIDFVFCLGIPKPVSHTVVPDGTWDHSPVVAGVELP
jgi:endonuclease/exonuclease/phosphatase family metal-dependent hydrolase